MRRRPLARGLLLPPLLLAVTCACAGSPAKGERALSAGTPSPGPASSGATIPAAAVTAGRSTGKAAFRLTAGQARDVATVVAFLRAYNGEQVEAALALFAEDAGASDCDYGAGKAVLYQDRPQVAGWLRQRAGEHDRLTLGAIENDNPDPRSGAHVVGVSFARRTSDVLTRLGFPDGIRPMLAAKVILTPDDEHLARFANGPVGGSPAACRPSG